MVAKLKKKYASGEAAQYMTRKSAIRYLQLTLKDFRRLCILKGIYPREPRNRKRAQKGKTTIQTLYHKKDIQFLSHEPIIWKIRDLKVFAKKMGKARAMKEYEEMRSRLNKYPTMNLDHLVKERYPTFIDALHDLDDCLTLCFLFSTFPSLRHVPKHQSALCRRLTVEFMHAVIAAKALRKVFVSIKGFYYQIEFKGQTITWITPHHFAFQPQDKNEVDFRIMATFVEFYTVMLGFINFHIYHSLNLIYPPKLAGYGIQEKEQELVDESVFVSERIAALNIPLCQSGDVDEDQEIDPFPLMGEKDDVEEQKAEIMKIQKQKVLFKGLKFFLNREVPREPLVFIIRCLGGLVSWDKLHFVGATFQESDETINYQVIDRPVMEKQYLSRYYIQPQWIFDSANACELLPVERYLIGAVLPPHLSPFSNEHRNQVYIPPEERALKDPNYVLPDSKPEDSDLESGNEEISKDEINQKEGGESDSNADEKDDEDEDDDDEDDEQALDEKNSNVEKSDQVKGMSVQPGDVYRVDPTETGRQKKQEFRLREKMVPKKHAKLYRSMMEGRKKRIKEIWLLRKKRRLIETAEKEGKKTAKKAVKADSSV